MMKKMLVFLLAAAMLLTAHLAPSLAETIDQTQQLNPNMEGAVSAMLPSGEVITFVAKDKRLENEAFTDAPNEELSKEDALTRAISGLIEKYGETGEKLARFSLEYGYVAESDAAFFRTPYWQFDFRNVQDDFDSYEVMVHAQDGEIIYIVGPDEGNG